MSPAPLAKRNRFSSTPSSSLTSAPRASLAIQDAITTLPSSSGDLDPVLYSQLLGSLSAAHSQALAAERAADAEDEIKRELAGEERALVIYDRTAATEPPTIDANVTTTTTQSRSVDVRSWIRTIQGELTEVQKTVLNDIETGLPKLEELVGPSCPVVPPFHLVLTARPTSGVARTGFPRASSRLGGKDRFDAVAIRNAGQSWNRMGRLLDQRLSRFQARQVQLISIIASLADVLSLLFMQTIPRAVHQA